MEATYIVITALVLGAIALGFIAYGVKGLVENEDKLNRRLAGAPGQAAGATGDAQRLVADDTRLKSFERYLTPDDEARQTQVRRKLALAGWRDPAAVRLYYGRMAIEKAFPVALDLLLVCIEAGHGLDQALARVARELKVSAPLLADELNLVVHQLRAGKERARVLHDFAERTNVEDIAAFVTVMKQSDSYGVSIADTLRVYASEMRHKRFMRAEEKANMMPIKLALGAIMFTIPPSIIVMIGPSIITVVRQMVNTAA